MLCLSTECYAKRAHPECVHVVAICQIASMEDGHLETDMHSVSSDVDTFDCREVLQCPSVWLVLTSRLISDELLHGTRSTAAVMASLAGVCIDLHSHVP
jgi:hypothetical protein